MSFLVQYVVVRGDLQTSLKWPVGALIAQACHACTAVVSKYKDDENVIQYTNDMDNMRKVILKATDDEQLRALADTLSQNNIDHKLWIEQPENISTCLVTKPYEKSQIQNYFKKLKLFK